MLPILPIRFSPAVDLPLEIWLYIASFIPPDQLRKLYAVNHALFVIAMEERYKEVHLCEELEMMPETLARLK